MIFLIYDIHRTRQITFCHGITARNGILFPIHTIYIRIILKTLIKSARFPAAANNVFILSGITQIPLAFSALAFTETERNPKKIQIQRKNHYTD